MVSMEENCSEVAFCKKHIMITDLTASTFLTQSNEVHYVGSFDK